MRAGKKVEAMAQVFVAGGLSLSSPALIFRELAYRYRLVRSFRKHLDDQPPERPPHRILLVGLLLAPHVVRRDAPDVARVVDDQAVAGLRAHAVIEPALELGGDGWRARRERLPELVRDGEEGSADVVRSDDVVLARHLVERLERNIVIASASATRQSSASSRPRT